MMLHLAVTVLFAQTDSGSEFSKPKQTVAKTNADSITKPIVKVKDTVSPKTDSLKSKVDSAVIKDSLSKLVADSLRKDSLQKATTIKENTTDTSTYASLFTHPFLPFNKPPIYQIISIRQPQQLDELFYLLLAIVSVIALIKIIFPKYFNNIFSIFFQTSFRQKHTREQLLQYKVASLSMNAFFFAVGALYITLLATQMQLVSISFWWLLLDCFILLIIIYVIKYLFLLFSGWLFNAKETAGTYVFLVFLVNKIIGIVLLPVVLILAFSSTEPYIKIIITGSLILVGILLLYRYITSVGTMRKDLNISAIHFFLYLCAVEIMPLLLIYKLLFNYIGAH
ncbi:MAG: DUF4271 domain-containing protein [Bacteroidetes bacterium]|nr:DUF4271 domain-containing protein [Bacteroidota bacterium]MBS1649334.1 DUF4271 domain-containing protein [Bacteroidota bacterium]